MRIEFHLPIIPPKTTSQQKRMAVVRGKPMFFKNKKGAEAEHDYLVLLAPYRPAKPLEGAISLSVVVTWPWRASEPKKRKALGRVPHTVKPDCSNWVKQLEDCLVKMGFLGDDSQVASLMVSKWWGDNPGIDVMMQEILEP